MRLGIAQINTTVGDLPGNRDLILGAYQCLVGQGAELVLFPELATAGYPPRDLLFKSRFVPDNEASLREIAASVGQVPAVIGFPQTNDSGQGRGCYNAVAWCEAGEVKQVARKCLLPTYDVFDEGRYFEPAPEPTVVQWRGLRLGLSICEDLWNHPDIPTRRHYALDPVDWFAGQGVDLLLNASASPWHYQKRALRLRLLADAAQRCGCPVVYANLVGGNDELIFDGHSLVIDAHRQIVGELPGFTAAEHIVEVPLGPDAPKAPADKAPGIPKVPQRSEAPDLQGIHDALVLGLRDYAHKTGFRTALIGLSGGIDSAVTAALAVGALGAENVLGVSLPSAISSQHSRDDARALAELLGIRYETLPIAQVVASAEQTLQPLFAGRPVDVTEENIQARARGLLLMALSNKYGSLLLTTGNKSEVAVGYCTLYGDMCGGLAVISDVPKTLVFALARWMNRERPTIPVNTIEKPPSAELRPDQKDEDSLPPYPVLDDILYRYVEAGQSRPEIIAAGYEPAIVEEVCRKVDLNEYKRKQAAPGLKITPLAFGVGRRIPIVQKYISAG